MGISLAFNEIGRNKFRPILDIDCWDYAIAKAQ
jgi:hypothetical protein